MKKILLGTSALASIVLAGNVYAADPTVTVGGFIDFQAGLVDQENAYSTGSLAHDLNFQNDTEVHIKASGKTDGGLEYGAVIELNADINADADTDGGNADKTYIYVESEAGRMEMGNNTGAQGAMKVDASTIAHGTGGIDGDFYDFVGGTSTYIFSPDLPSDFTMNIREDATKVTYYTPRWSGLQLGASFTPDDGNGGTAAGFSGDVAGQNENVIGLGINYENTYKGGQMDGIGVRASLTGETGDSEVSTREDLNAWQTGAALSYQGFSVAGSYADWADSGLATTGLTEDNQNFWTAGAAYENGPYGLSLTYLDSEATDGATKFEFNNVVVSADYQLAPGLVPYVEVNFFEMDDNNIATSDNEGNAVLFGTQLNF